jgi:hypothetical protein
MGMKNIRVIDMKEDAKRGVIVATVRASSAEQVKGRPAARVHLEITIDAVAGEKRRITSRRAYDEALMYLTLE